jgi:hypothetical protein
MIERIATGRLSSLGHPSQLMIKLRLRQRQSGKRQRHLNTLPFGHPFSTKRGMASHEIAGQARNDEVNAKEHGVLCHLKRGDYGKIPVGSHPTPLFTKGEL